MNSFTSKSKPKTDDQTHRTLPKLLSKVNPVGKKLWKRDHEGKGGDSTRQPIIEARNSLERAFKLDVQSLDRGRHLTDTSKWNYSTDIGVEAAAGEGKPSNFSQQPLSPFFSRLHTEIREVIWDLVLCSNERIDFFLRKTESGSIDLRGMACKEPENGSPYHKCTREERTESSQVAFNAVLRCCKLAYVETSSILYSRNHFAFDDKETFHVFFEIVPPQLYSQIQHLTLHNTYSRQAQLNKELYLSRNRRELKIVKTMERLKYLCIIVDISDDWNELCRFWDDDPYATENMGLNVDNWTNLNKVLPQECKVYREAIPQSCRLVAYVECGFKPPFEIYEITADNTVERLGSQPLP